MKSVAALFVIIFLASSCLPNGEKGQLTFVLKEKKASHDSEPIKVPVVNFESVNNAIFKPKCATCHSDRRRAGGVRLEQYEDFIEELVLPGDAANSFLLSIVTDPDPDIRMPPRRPALSQEEIEAITNWINAGAVQ